MLRLLQARSLTPLYTSAWRPSRAAAVVAAGLQRRPVAACFSSRVDPDSVVDVQGVTEKVYDETLAPLNGRLMGPLDQSTHHLTPMPLVFVLGNHSSGKSSFLNFVVNRQIQAAGVAPTDDGFTIIAPGTEDADQDGPSLIGDDGLGFSGLRLFGTPLINHVTLKIRKNLDIQNIMLVDSPGMIDSPMHDGSNTDLVQASMRGRGYDFPGVIRWFAERADVILLFFDPDKPGTTGETLACMTSSLSGLDHKVRIILNKVDQFERMHDFARAYGSLCWNLSKVIQKKDMPRIYTMCIPGYNTSGMLKDAAADMEAARKEVLQEVRSAPMRRVDNCITQLYNSARLLRMHGIMLEAVRKSYASQARKYNGVATLLALSGSAMAGTAFFTGMWQIGVPAAAVTALATVGTWFWGQRELGKLQALLTSNEGLDQLFRENHVAALAQNDEFVVSLWKRVRPQLQLAIKTIKINALPKVKSSDIADLDEVIDEEVPALRKAASKSSSINFDATFSHRKAVS